MLETDLEAKLFEKLSEEVAELPWTDLEPHHQRGVLMLVKVPERLVEIAVAMACNNVASVSLWMAQGCLQKSIDLDADNQALLCSKRFRFVIVSPFVVAAVVSSAHDVQ